MIADAISIPNGACLQVDVCVVGGDPAGIALTLALSERGLSVVLLESGQLALDAKTQSLYEGEVADEHLHSPPDKYRQRRLGCSTAIWGGRCTPLDPIDFETRSRRTAAGRCLTTTCCPTTPRPTHWPKPGASAMTRAKRWL
jgi:choline dehydrogenase-like flavoprotein